MELLYEVMDMYKQVAMPELKKAEFSERLTYNIALLAMKQWLFQTHQIAVITSISSLGDWYYKVKQKDNNKLLSKYHTRHGEREYGREQDALIWGLKWAVENLIIKKV